MSGLPRICLIDDDAFVRDALTLSLGDAGYEVLAAADGRAGLDLVLANDIVAVITDMNMPGSPGAALIAAVRAARAELPIIAITGGGEINGVPVEQLARDAGANVCLSKPFRGKDIAAAIERLRAARA